jgi:energy-coupling factor transporter ATP-binding protein EcfA2
MASISYIDATCIYQGATAPSVADLSLDVEDGEFIVLVGPSGSGKSTPRTRPPRIGTLRWCSRTTRCIRT